MIRSAYSLMIGDYIYDVQIDGERRTVTTPARIKATWQHGPCITVLTTAGYVEYDEFDLVKTA